MFLNFRAAAAWVDSVEQFGSQNLTLSEILAPALKMAEEGFPVAPVCAYYWGRSQKFVFQFVAERQKNRYFIDNIFSFFQIRNISLRIHLIERISVFECLM